MAGQKLVSNIFILNIYVSDSTVKKRSLKDVGSQGVAVSGLLWVWEKSIHQWNVLENCFCLLANRCILNILPCVSGRAQFRSPSFCACCQGVQCIPGNVTPKWRIVLPCSLTTGTNLALVNLYFCVNLSVNLYLV